ncbi:shikimate kinase [Desulfobotulus alkaliphilus]|uniref:Shikimate kinase n=1 Tax=Desulfobotulus alkaliphilus TaxID=622671 RepID=A0A562S676_9BACT|nr:shikimate kinase [Desulfobotulus alkaliphilus]TWI76871.1 shikimate kinase [Desulfobotulus alkaliphilus]
MKTTPSPQPQKTTLTLTGMPGAGKSTLGVLAAKILGMDFMDTDLLIQSHEKMRLSEIIEQKGLDAFREIEARHVAALKVSHTVIATGGSVIYSEKAMENLASQGPILHLALSLPELAKRLGNLDERGVVRKPGQSLEALFHERMPLYRKWADAEITCDGLSMDDLLCRIRQIFPPLSP